MERTLTSALLQQSEAKWSFFWGLFDGDTEPRQLTDEENQKLVELSRTFGTLSRVASSVDSSGSSHDLFSLISDECRRLIGLRRLNHRSMSGSPT